MKCPECVDLEDRSTVTPGMAITTCMYAPPGYFDEDGEWIKGEDPNITTTNYHCSKGHVWAVATRGGKVI